LPLNEAIIEVIVRAERTWGDMHHKSYFLPELGCIENGEFKLAIIIIVDRTVYHFSMHGVYAEGNTTNISETTPINIYRNPDVVENISLEHNSHKMR
jgi:hypothetical protein